MPVISHILRKQERNKVLFEGNRKQTENKKSCSGQADEKQTMNKKQLNTENMKTRISRFVAALLLVAGLAIGNVNATEHDGKASSHESNETALVIENWMMDETVWNTSDLLFTEAEQALEIENWMTNEFVWEAQPESLALENWMINKNLWEIESAFNTATEAEQNLSTEQWMINENIWKI